MKILVTICGRAGSKGAKNKNIRIFMGQPIVYFALSAYQLFCQKYGDKFEQIDLAVNTDSKELLQQLDATKVGYICVPRKDELAGDRVSKPSVIKDTVIEAEHCTGVNYDIALDLDLTSPLRGVDDLYGVLQLMMQKKDIDVVFSMSHSRRSPFFNMVRKTDEGDCELILESDYVSRQQAPECYDMNASIYAYRKAFLISEGMIRVFDGKTAGYLMRDTAVLDIDSDEDFDLISWIAPFLCEKYKEYAEVESYRKELA